MSQTILESIFEPKLSLDGPSREYDETMGLWKTMAQKLDEIAVNTRVTDKTVTAVAEAVPTHSTDGISAQTGIQGSLTSSFSDVLSRFERSANTQQKKLKEGIQQQGETIASALVRNVESVNMGSQADITAPIAEFAAATEMDARNRQAESRRMRSERAKGQARDAKGRFVKQDPAAALRVEKEQLELSEESFNLDQVEARHEEKRHKQLIRAINRQSGGGILGSLAKGMFLRRFLNRLPGAPKSPSPLRPGTRASRSRTSGSSRGAGVLTRTASSAGGAVRGIGSKLGTLLGGGLLTRGSGTAARTAGTIAGGAVRGAGAVARGAAGAGKLGLRAIPVAGQIAALGLAGFDAFNGWNDKESQRRAFGLKEGQEASTGQKASTAIANVLDMGGLTSDLLGMFGIKFDKDALTRNLYNFGTQIGAVGEQLKDFAVTAWPTVKEKALQFGSFLWDSGKKLGSAVGDWVADKWNWAVEGTKQFGNNLLAKGTELASTVGDWISNKWNAVTDTTAQFVTNTAQGALNIASNVGSFFVEKWNGLLTSIDDFAAKISQGALDIATNVGSFFAEKWGNVLKGAGEFGDEILAGISTLGSNVKNFAENAWNTVLGGAGSLGMHLSDFATGIAGSFKDFFEDKWKKVSEGAVSLGSALVQGAKGLWDDVTGWFKSDDKEEPEKNGLSPDVAQEVQKNETAVQSRTVPSIKEEVRKNIELTTSGSMTDIVSAAEDNEIDTLDINDSQKPVASEVVAKSSAVHENTAINEGPGKDEAEKPVATPSAVTSDSKKLTESTPTLMGSAAAAEAARMRTDTSAQGEIASNTEELIKETKAQTKMLENLFNSLFSNVTDGFAQAGVAVVTAARNSGGNWGGGYSGGGNWGGGYSGGGNGTWTQGAQTAYEDLAKFTDRGSRNINPGNVKGTGYLGQVGLDDKNHAIFATKEAGVAGIVDRLYRYNQDYTQGDSLSGKKTIRQIMTTYAPASDNNNTEQYIANITKALGISADQQIDFTKNPELMKPFVKEIMRNESYGWKAYSEAEIDKGIEIGVDEKRLGKEAAAEKHAAYLQAKDGAGKGVSVGGSEARAEALRAAMANGTSKELSSGVSAMIADVTQDAVNRGMRYELGAKSMRGRTIDCSGFVQAMGNQTMLNINEAMGGEVFSKDVRRYFNKGASTEGAAGILRATAQMTGKLYSQEELSPENIKEGMIIGTAKRGDSRVSGRFKGIGHVVQTFRDPKTGEMMVSESTSWDTSRRGRNGVMATPYKQWHADNMRRGTSLYGADMLALADMSKARLPQTTVQAQEKTSVDSQQEVFKAIEQMSGVKTAKIQTYDQARKDIGLPPTPKFKADTERGIDSIVARSGLDDQRKTWLGASLRNEAMRGNDVNALSDQLIAQAKKLTRNDIDAKEIAEIQAKFTTWRQEIPPVAQIEKQMEPKTASAQPAEVDNVAVLPQSVPAVEAVPAKIQNFQTERARLQTAAEATQIKRPQQAEIIKEEKPTSPPELMSMVKLMSRFVSLQEAGLKKQDEANRKQDAKGNSDTPEIATEFSDSHANQMAAM